MISSTSSLASSMPATSLKVTLFWCSVSSFALDLPKLIALPPPACSWRMKKKKITNRKTIGSQETSSVCHIVLSSFERTLHGTLYWSRAAVMSLPAPEYGPFTTVLLPPLL